MSKIVLNKIKIKPIFCLSVILKMSYISAIWASIKKQMQQHIFFTLSHTVGNFDFLHLYSTVFHETKTPKW